MTWATCTGSSGAPVTTEKQLLAQVIDLAHITGHLTYHTHDSRRSQPGYPDLTIVGRGRVLWLELKTTTGRVTPAQRRWLNALTDAGQDARVVRPADLQHIADLLGARP